MHKFILLLALLFSGITSFAKDLPPRPNPPALVNDYTGTLSASDKQTLESKLLAYSDSTSTQIAIVIENSLDGDDAFDYSHRLATAWQIGMKGKNNGLLIYVALADHKIWIQNGYGMEGTVTDALSKRIIEQNIKPNFREGRYFQGLNEATDIIMRAASGEYINEEPVHHNKKKKSSPLMVIIFIILAIIVSIFSNRGGRGGGRRGGFSPFLFGTLGSGGFSSGGFGGGGGGGGGSFGGFGGGGFGGGGAGGSW